jgi:hypothetical protein
MPWRIARPPRCASAVLGAPPHARRSTPSSVRNLSVIVPSPAVGKQQFAARRSVSRESITNHRGSEAPRLRGTEVISFDVSVSQWLGARGISRVCAVPDRYTTPRKTTNASSLASSALFSSMCPWTFPRLLSGCNLRLPLSLHVDRDRDRAYRPDIAILSCRGTAIFPRRHQGLPPTSVIVHTGEV